MIWQMVQSVDLFVRLDEAKRVKTSMNNDFAFYNRIMKYSKVSEEEGKKMACVRDFLNTPYWVVNQLKAKLASEPNTVALYLRCINYCLTALESKYYVLPSEYHCLLRSIGILVRFVSDSSCDKKAKKAFRYGDAVERLLRTPVVPLFYDLHCDLRNYLQDTEFASNPKTTLSLEADAYASEYEPRYTIDAVRTAHKEYISQYALLINEVKAFKQGESPKRVSPELASRVVRHVQAGLEQLCDWSNRILMQLAYKCSTPSRSGVSANAYQKAVQYNYTEADLQVLLELVAMVKSLETTFLGDEEYLMESLRVGSYSEMRTFSDSVVEMMVGFSQKKGGTKYPVIHNLLKRINAYRDDAVKGDEVRTVALSLGQLMELRLNVYDLMVFQKEFSAKDWQCLEVFYKHTFFVPYLLNFGSTVQRIADLSVLWFREFYLEMTKELQFPIEMSLPWILADYVIGGMDGGIQQLTEYVLYPFAIYNDAGNRALHEFRQRYLYEEVEAEMNLCFDQLIFNLSNKVYLNFKLRASSLYLEQHYLCGYEKLVDRGDVEKLKPLRARFNVITEQRTVQFLGRVVNLNHLLGIAMEKKLKENIRFAIERFEASDITAVVELEAHLEVLRLTHRFLSGCFELTGFPELLREVDDSVSLTSFHGRIALHVIYELLSDFTANFVLNAGTKRYVRAENQTKVERNSLPRMNAVYHWGTKPLAAAYGDYLEGYRTFFGQPHLLALVRVIGTSALALVVDEVANNIKERLSDEVLEKLAALLVDLPSVKLPHFNYHVEGCLSFYEAKLKDVLAYNTLPKVLGDFKEVGNLLSLCYYLEQAQRECVLEEFVQAGPFVGVTELENTVLAPLAKTPVCAAASAAVARVASGGTPFAASVLRESLRGVYTAARYHASWDKNYSLFRGVLLRVRDALAENSVAWNARAEFCSVCGTLEFAHCFITHENQRRVLPFVGDGLAWAGVTLVHLLGQFEKWSIANFNRHALKMDAADGAEDVLHHATNRMPAGLRKKPAAPDTFIGKAQRLEDFSMCLFSVLRSYVTPLPTIDPALIAAAGGECGADGTPLFHPPKEFDTKNFFKDTKTI